jgi:hypothetical protein
MPTRLFALFLALCLLILPAGAEAGQTARYRNAEIGGTIVVEVQGADARLEFSGLPWHLLIRNGESFWVYDLPSGPRVLRVADFERVIREEHLTMPELPSTTAGYQLVPRGAVVVAGYRGTAYHIRIPEGTSSNPTLIISRDPALADLGRPLARHLDSSILQFRLSGRNIPPLMLRIRDLVGQGTALQFMGYRLERVETSEIGGERFALPAPPVSYEEALRNFRMSGLAN